MSAWFILEKFSYYQFRNDTITFKFVSRMLVPTQHLPAQG